MKVIKICVALLLTVSASVAQKDEPSGIPEDAIVNGPIPTRLPKTSITRYYKPGSNIADPNSLIAIETLFNDTLVERRFMKNGNIHGRYETWHKNGQKESSGLYQDGTMNGVFRHWDNKGNLVARYQMNKGSGTKLVFNSNGLPNDFEEYTNGKLNGWNVPFYSNGQIKSVNRMENGDYVSHYYVSYFEDGSLYFMAYVNKNKKPSGVMVYYDRGGQFSHYVHMLQGQRVTEEEYDSATEDDESIPKVFDDPHEYKKRINPEVVEFVKQCKDLKPVHIPLRFNEKDEILRIDGQTFRMPK